MIITGFRKRHREIENARFIQLSKLGNIENCTKYDAILHPRSTRSYTRK